MIRKTFLSLVCIILLVLFVTGCNNETNTSVSNQQNVSSDLYGEANDDVENLVEKLKNSGYTITVTDYENWNKKSNFFELETFYEIDLKTNIGYIHEETIDYRGHRYATNEDTYLDFNNDIEYSIYKGWSDWKKKKYLDSIDHYLMTEYFDDYDYIKKGNVFYGRYEKYGDYFIIEIHLNDDGFIDYYIDYTADENLQKDSDSVIHKCTYSYSDKTITIPQKAIDEAE